MFKSAINYRSHKSMGYRFRKARFKNIETIIYQILKVKSKCKILDVGGTSVYWHLLPPELIDRVSITILNLNIPKGSDVNSGGPQNIDLHFEVGDGRQLSHFDDNSFDLVHSNSVIEHVGLIKDMMSFANEVQRVGYMHYVQTPNIWFPIDPHYGVPFFHWLPWPVRAKILCAVSVGFKDRFSEYYDAVQFIEFVNLLDESAIKLLFPNSKILKERFLLLTKSLMVVGGAVDI